MLLFHGNTSLSSQNTLKRGRKLLQGCNFLNFEHRSLSTEKMSKCSTGCSNGLQVANGLNHLEKSAGINNMH